MVSLSDSRLLLSLGPTPHRSAAGTSTGPSTATRRRGTQRCGSPSTTRRWPTRSPSSSGESNIYFSSYDISLQVAGPRPAAGGHAAGGGGDAAAAALRGRETRVPVRGHAARGPAHVRGRAGQVRAAGAGLRCNGDLLVSRFVCDGRVNCMMPGREAVDEQEQFCSSARHTETDTGNKLLSFIVIRMIRIQNFLPGRPCFYQSHHSRAWPWTWPQRCCIEKIKIKCSISSPRVSRWRCELCPPDHCSSVLISPSRAALLRHAGRLLNLDIDTYYQHSNNLFDLHHL